MRSATFLLLLWAALGFLYGRTLGYGWLEVGDAALRAPASLAEAWRAGGPAAASLFLERGESALAARLVAWLLHAGSSAVVLALGRRLGLTPVGALLLAALFALHPLRVEPVLWLSRRATLLAAFLLLWSAWLALGAGRSGRLRGLALVLGLAGVASLAWQPGDEDPLAFGVALVHLPLSLGALAARWLLPLGLTPNHPLEAPGSAAGFGAAWLVLLALLGLLFWLRRRAPRVALGGLAFVTMGGASVLAARGEGLFRESDGYLAALGLELALVAALEFALRSPLRLPLGSPLGSRPGARALGTVLAGAVLLLGTLAWNRIGAWSSEETLQARALATNPADARALDTLGLWHLAHGRVSAAQRAAERALELRPADRLARLHLGELELRRALIPGHESHFLAAEQHLLGCEPAGALTARVAARLGEVYQRTGDFERARQTLARAVHADARDARSQARLGMVALRLGDVAAAQAAFERASEHAPRAVEGWCGLGIVAFQQNDLAGARAHFERALALEPDHVESRATLGRIQELQGEQGEAEQNYRRALGVNPDSVDALYALGELLARSERGEEALAYLERVLALSRDRPHVRALLQSARLRLARGEVELARQRLSALLAFNPEHAEARALLASLAAGADGR